MGEKGIGEGGDEKHCLQIIEEGIGEVGRRGRAKERMRKFRTDWSTRKREISEERD